MNVLKPHLQTTIWTLLAAGASQREIERVTGIDRKTIRGYQKRFAAMAANWGDLGFHALCGAPVPQPCREAQNSGASSLATQARSQNRKRPPCPATTCVSSAPTGFPGPCPSSMSPGSSPWEPRVSPANHPIHAIGAFAWLAAGIKHQLIGASWKSGAALALIRRSAGD